MVTGDMVAPLSGGEGQPHDGDLSPAGDLPAPAVTDLDLSR